MSREKSITILVNGHPKEIARWSSTEKGVVTYDTAIELAGLPAKPDYRITVKRGPHFGATLGIGEHVVVEGGEIFNVAHAAGA
jgi:hypothetical protein